MSKLDDRSRLIMDGTYVNAPDLHIIAPSKNIGLREFNNGILIHNWYEERSPFDKKEFQSNSTYQLDYKPYPDTKPDIVLRRKLIGASNGAGSKNLIGMHNFDSSKNMITLYDENINRRYRPPPEVPEGQQFPDKRKWKIVNDEWVPEKSDYPLQDAPTNWGLFEKRKNKLLREKDKYANQLPNLTEYTERYQKHSKESYLQRSTMGVPKDISSSNYELNNFLNNTPMTRSTSGALRQPQARDVMDTVYKNMLAKSNRAPRTYYYLGKVPTNGALDVYSMKDYETLTSKYEPTQLKAAKDDGN